MKQVFQFNKMGKQFLLPIILFAATLATTAQPLFQNKNTVSREIPIDKPFDQVEVMGDVTIILTNNFEGRLILHGDIDDLQLAKASVKNRKLIIDAKRKKRDNKLTLYLPVSGLDMLTTSGKTEVISSGTIKTKNLEILLYGSSIVSINYEGKLRVTPGTGYELERSIF